MDILLSWPGQLSKIIDVAVQEQETPLDGEQGRGLWSLIQMLAHENSLSLRSLLICGDNGIGEKCFRFLEEISRQRPIEFLGATREVSEKPSLVPNLEKRLARDTLDILNLLNSFRERELP
jgi:hypothetical protein